MSNEVRIRLTKNADIAASPGDHVLNKPYATITVRTSTEEFVFEGEGATALAELNMIRSGKSNAKEKRCNTQIRRDGGAVAVIAFA